MMSTSYFHKSVNSHWYVKLHVYILDPIYKTVWVPGKICVVLMFPLLKYVNSYVLCAGEFVDIYADDML